MNYQVVSNMNNQTGLNIQIPSFNPSLSSSRKSKLNAQDINYQNSYQNMYNFNKKPYEIGSIPVSLPAQSTKMHQQFWEQFFEQENNKYKNLINKHNILEQSIKLHKQALTLRNSQAIQTQDRVAAVSAKIKILNSNAKQNQLRIKHIAEKCQQAKVSIQGIRTKIHKQQALIIQQDKHTQQIQQRIKRMEQQIIGLERQLKDMTQKQKIYYEIVQQNQNVFQYLSKIRSEASYTKIKIDKDIQQEQNIMKKMKQLQKVVSIRQKNNRQLGKKLIQLKRLNPEAVSLIHQSQSRGNSGQKVPKLGQILKNIKDMQYQYGKIQQQIYQITDKIQTTSDKMSQKMRSIQILKHKFKKNYGDGIQNQHNPIKQTQNQNGSSDREYVRQQQYQSTQMRANNQNLAQPFQSTNLNKKPIGYRVIQSQENQHIIYPRTTTQNIPPNQNLNQYSYQNSQSGHPSRTASYSQRQHTSQNQSQTGNQSQSYPISQEKPLQITESIKNLLSRYENIRNKSRHNN